MNPPTRDELTGSWPRIIRYRRGYREPILRSLAQITWCTKWIATKDDYTTVHEITDDTIQNAYAAGYTNQDILETTGVKVDSYETLTLKNNPTQGLFDRGHYYLEGEMTRVAHMYAMMYHMCEKTEHRLAHMFDMTRAAQNVLPIQPSTITVSKKNAQSQIRTRIEDPLPLYEKAKRVKKISHNVLQFHIEKTKGHYECHLAMLDASDVWPTRSGKLSDVFKHHQVIDAGDIVDSIRSECFHIAVGQWEPVQNPQNDDEVMSQLQGRNMERSIQCDKSMHGLVETRRTLHAACKEHLVIVPEDVDVSGRHALGLRSSLWSQLHTDDPMFEGTELYDIVRQRKINPYEDSETPPTYGKIPYGKNAVSFRQAQKAALDLMFRNDRIHSGIYILPCGGGKTLLGIAAAVRSGSKRVLVMVPNETIATQWKLRFFQRASVRAKTLKEIGRMSLEDMRDTSTSLVAVVSWNKLAWKCGSDEEQALEGSRLNPLKITAVENALFCNWDIVIIDEVHNIRSPQNMCLLSKLSYKCMIGLTATASKEPEYPWHVDVAPIMYETAWPLQNAHVINVACEPWLPQLFEQIYTEESGDNTFSEQKTQRTNIKTNIYTRMKEQLPDHMTSYESMLEYNPNKIETIARIIEAHEAANRPIIVFADHVFHMKLFRRRFVNMHISYRNNKFGDYLRACIDTYIRNTIHNKYMAPFGLQEDFYEWRDDFSRTWDPTAYRNNTQLMELCPDVPIDGVFSIHYLEAMQNEENKFIERVEGICGMSIENVQKVNPDQYAELFFLLDTPRWVMFGQTDERNMPSQHRHHVYDKFKRGDIKTLFLTRIGNEGVDLPNTRVIIIASGQGSKETEDPQRFGRALRDAEVGDQPRFLYEVFTDTGQRDELNKERNQAEKREKFLKARGYRPSEEPGENVDFTFEGVVGPNFIMTPDIKAYLISGNHRLTLDTFPGEAPEFLVINERGCTYIRRQYVYDNNLMAVEYIAEQLGFEMNIREERVLH